MRSIPSLATALAIAATGASLLAHGGQYRGPGNVVPPSSGGGGSSGASSPGAPGGGSSGPTGPGPAGPTSPAGAGSAAGMTTAATGGVGAGAAGYPIGEDLTRWSYWWEFNKDPYLRLRARTQTAGSVAHSDEMFMGATVREGTDSLRPTLPQIRDTLVPALHRTLASTDQRDITSSCLVALAKIGLDTPDHELLPELTARLRAHDQEIRETAALALGISQRLSAVPVLVALVQDDQLGRELVERGRVDERTRSFAAYGLGLIAYATSSTKVKRQAFETLRAILEDRQLPGRNLKVAAVNALGLLRPDHVDPAGESLAADIVTALELFYSADLGPGMQLVQAHAAPAIASVLQARGVREDIGRFQRLFLKELEGSKRREHVSLRQSAAMALGKLAEPHERGSRDAEVSKALYDYYQRGRDQQSRYFALITLAEIGGSENRAALLRALDEGTKALQKPWAALALGIFERNRLEANPGASDDPEIGRAILREMKNLKNPESLAATAIGLGLARHAPAADRLRELLVEHRNKDALAGYLCVALALMDDRRSIGMIRDIVSTSSRRSQLLLQSAIALGVLGDKKAADLLVSQMTAAANFNIAMMSSLAYALGRIGDRRCIDPLVQMLEDERLPDLTRAFAAVALGGTADKEPLPWNSKISRAVNYRAAVETLTNQVSGILDIL